MRFRSFIIAYTLVAVAILLFADQRPKSSQSHQQNRYSHVVDLSEEASVAPAAVPQDSPTRILSPAAFIPGTWEAGQIPAERLIAPLVVMDVNAPSAQISLNDVANWESRHGYVPQGAIVAIRQARAATRLPDGPFPVAADAAQFLMDARSTLAFVIESRADLSSDRPLARQLALHGNYIVDGSARLAALPENCSLVIVAPVKNKRLATAPVRVLAMVR
jgi:kynurenine formamidase